MANCPNCGAPITSNKCEYCGTVHGRGVSYYESLKRENDAINSAIKVNELYTEALIAMRRYADGIYTTNEVRKIMGMSDI